MTEKEREREKEKKKKKQEEWLNAQIMAILEKSLKAGLAAAMDDLFSDWQ